MKKIFSCLMIVTIFTINIIPCCAEGVLCTSDKSMCTLGKYTLRGQNLYTSDGIMCTSDKNICTNGYTIFRTESSNSITTNTTNNKKNNVITYINEGDTLTDIAELYAKNLITQTEFNKIKKSNTLSSSEIYELEKLGNLYDKGMISQFEYNKKKIQMLNNFL